MHTFYIFFIHLFVHGQFVFKPQNACYVTWGFPSAVCFALPCGSSFHKQFQNMVIHFFKVRQAFFSPVSKDRVMSYKAVVIMVYVSHLQASICTQRKNTVTPHPDSLVDNLKHIHRSITLSGCQYLFVIEFREFIIHPEHEVFLFLLLSLPLP